MDIQIFKQRFREAILQSKFSLAEIAKMTEINLNTLKGYIYKSKMPSTFTFAKLYNCLHFNANYILQIKLSP